MTSAALFTDEEQLLVAAVRECAEGPVRAAVPACEKSPAFAAGVHAELAGLGLFGLGMDEELGGTGSRRILQAAAFEALARESGATALLAMVQSLAAEALTQASDGRHQPALEGARVATLVLEPLAAPDASGKATLTGILHAVPAMGVAEDVVLRTGEGAAMALWHVRAAGAGVEMALAVEPLGMHGAALGTLRLTQAPADLLVQGEAALDFLAIARLHMSALLAGVAQGSIAPARRYAGERAQFGREIIHLFGVQERLARAAARAAGLSAQWATAALSAGAPGFRRAALLARWAAASEAVLVADDCLQVFGGFGFSREYPAERYLRDARFPGLGEFTCASAAQELAEL